MGSNPTLSANSTTLQFDWPGFHRVLPIGLNITFQFEPDPIASDPHARVKNHACIQRN